VDFAPFVVSDVGDLAEFLKGNLNNKAVRFDKERSALGSVRAFPENVEIEALLTYSPNDRSGLNLNTIPDDRYIPVTLHYSFSAPDVPMLPRLADDRTGYPAGQGLSRDNREHFWVRYVNRWRLGRGPERRALEPVSRSSTTSITRSPKITALREARCRAWRRSGGRVQNAIIARDAPADSAWDPGDVRYSTIRWITSSEPSFGAIGLPGRPTGEILTPASCSRPRSSSGAGSP
jgi:hypothetical protein